MDRRKLEEKLFKALMILSTLLVLGSLLCILGTIVFKGLPALTWEMITQTPEGGYYLGKGGGILNAILGSLAIGIGGAFLSVLISLPLAIYLNLYLKRKSRLGFLLRFSLDVLWGIPSIVYGAFGFMLMVFLGIPTSLLAGIITIALLILPIMARSMDEVFKFIPNELKEASLSLGATEWETATKIMIRQALPGIVTAILIAFGRGISDAAAVLFTAGFTDSLPHSFFKPVATLPLAIFFQLATPFPEVQQRGYAAALVLTGAVLLLSVFSRVLSRHWTKYSIK